MTSENFTSKSNRIDDVLQKPALLRGYESIRRGQEFDYDVKSWEYERGRQLAILVRQVLGYVPAMPQSLELVRPIYITARLEGTLLPRNPPENMVVLYADTAGRFSPQKYAAIHFRQSSSSVLDNLF